MSGIEAIADLLDYCTDDELREIDAILAENTPIWVPLPGPQTEAYHCDADILYYGGAAGGGKSDMLLGLALTAHQRSIIYRREGTQNLALVDRLLNELLKDRRGWNGQDHVWRGMGRQIEFGACKDLGDEQRYQGRAHDFKAFDEITHFLESQFRFLMGWLRSPDKNQRKRVVCTGNPPTNEDGQWVVSYWAPWLDDKHPNPAKPGELRWYTTIDGKDQECADGKPFKHKGKLIQPLSRSFIPSRVQDNVFMMDSGYEAILQALPEPLRSQMLQGDFRAGLSDSAWQVIPSGWVDAAMERWEKDGAKGQMDSVGADIARGGKDKTVIATRYGSWYAPLKVFPGQMTPDGPTAAGLIISEVRDSAPIHVDVIGVGSSVVDHLIQNRIQCVPINGAESAETKDKSGMLRFRNKRAELYWQFREALDPRTGLNIALPPDSELKADLCAPTFKLTASGILIESKQDIIDRIGRSPDKADAVVYCSVNTMKDMSLYELIVSTNKTEDFNIRDWIRR